MPRYARWEQPQTPYPDPLFEILIALAPPLGSPWPRNRREKWLHAVAAIIDLLYEEEAQVAQLTLIHPEEEGI